jgi:ribose transport system permease protein
MLINKLCIGGAKLSGGVGKMSGTLFGALIMGSFSNIFTLQRFLDPVWELVVVGSVLLSVFCLQAIVAIYRTTSKIKEKEYHLHNSG